MNNSIPKKIRYKRNKTICKSNLVNNIKCR